MQLHINSQSSMFVKGDNLKVQTNKGEPILRVTPQVVPTSYKAVLVTGGILITFMSA